jgi:hypothetical protein
LPFLKQVISGTTKTNTKKSALDTESVVIYMIFGTNQKNSNKFCIILIRVLSSLNFLYLNTRVPYLQKKSSGAIIK